MKGRKSADTLDIDEVRTRFERWRQTRKGRARIPDELWSAAVQVARRDGVNQTAVALRLDGGKLKRRIMATGWVPDKTMPPAFVEMMVPKAVGGAECTIELEGRNGTSLRPPARPVAESTEVQYNFRGMECKERQRLTEEYFDAFKRQQWISERLKGLRASGDDPQIISAGEKQEDAAIEESYEAWEALNGHQCSERCERG